MTDHHQATPPAYQMPQAETLLRRVLDLIEQARPVPLSASSMIIKEEVLEPLEAAIAAMPDELRAARWLLKERDDFLKRVQGEGDQIISTARTQAERMMQRTELVQAAEERARQIIAEAEDQARQMKLETEDWCDQKLGAMEVVMERTLGMLSSGRAKLQGAEPADDVEIDEQIEERVEIDSSPIRQGFYDQDDS